MSPTKPKNIAASVRQGLTNISKQRGEEFQFVLSECDRAIAIPDQSFRTQ
jgi:hypothetical protein